VERIAEFESRHPLQFSTFCNSLRFNPARIPEVIFNPPRGKIGKEIMYSREFFAQQGALGGKASAARLTAAQRRAKAIKAVNSRNDRQKKKSK
jgi:hypothetical protein